MSLHVIKKYKAHCQALDDYHTCLKREYPIGSPVKWYFNGKLWTGKILEHGFADRVKVYNGMTMRSRWIRGWQICEASIDHPATERP